MIDNNTFDDASNTNYFASFISQTLKEIEEKGIAYVFSNEQIKAIKKYVPDLQVSEQDFGWTISSKSRRIIKIKNE